MSASLFLFACAETPSEPKKDVDAAFWESSKQCGGDEVYTVATFMASTIDKDKGFGGGNKLLGATTDGRIVTIKLQVSDTFKNAPPVKGRDGVAQLRDVVLKKSCKEPVFKRFLSLGGEFHMDLILKSGKSYRSAVIKNC
ncbi:hypothetical protein GCM10007939_18570 [Amylibacter marinus]|uniref:Lipoprotein n=1 Tax=Amylibacter marinus TaxID=1475483 RepID=A0ABQ5VW88_9RHOB|nr:hypothetical protein GCM10007939_18570 [Amylibacter marinus]